MLTRQQIDFFETFGFLCLRQLFSPEEMAGIARETDELLAANTGKRTGPSHQSASNFVEMGTGLARLPEDDRIYGPVGQLLGEGFVWGNSEGVCGSFNETNDHPWHCDRAGQIDLDYRRLKIMIYLQPMRRETGALRVIPGSHHAPFHRELLRLQSQHQGTAKAAFGVDGDELSCHAPRGRPGGRGLLRPLPLPRRVRKAERQALHRPEVRRQTGYRDPLRGPAVARAGRLGAARLLPLQRQAAHRGDGEGAAGVGGETGSIA